MAVPRRILQLCHDYEGPFRSICRQYVCAFPDAHVTTLFICGDRSEDVAREVGGDEVHFLERPHRAMRGLKLVTLRQLHPVFRDGNFDLVIAQRYRPVYFAGILSLFNDIPLIVGVTHEHGVYRSRARRRVIRYGKNIVLAGVSESVSDDLERDLPGLRAAGRLHTLPNAIEPSRADAMMARQAARQALGLPDDRFIFGTIGRLIDKKCHHVLIGGFTRFVAAGGDGDLVIVGDGPCRDALEAQVVAGGVGDRVRFVDRISDAYRYLKAFDAFVLSSGPLEAFGVVLLEAMAARLPIVTSTARGPLEVVGESALTFAVGDDGALAQQLARLRTMDDRERERLGDSGHRRYLDGFTPEVVARRLRQMEPVRRVLDTV